MISRKKKSQTHNQIIRCKQAFIDISNGQIKMSNWPAQNKLLDVDKTYIDIWQKFELKMQNWPVLRSIQ